MSIKTLVRNISNSEWEESPVQPFSFPAGERSVKYHNSHQLKGDHLAIVQGADANDYMTLRIWAYTIRNGGGTPRAIIPYLPAARDDHRSSPFTARDYAWLINESNLAQVVCLDPHSSVMPEMLNECTVLYGIPLIEQAIKDTGTQVAGVIIPDAGAINRSSYLAERLGVPTHQALKHRDPSTGKLSGFTCDPLPDEGLMLVSDDICDGGGTFMGLAEATGLPKERLALWVTHGVFSGNATQLHERYSTIMATDSLEPQSPVVRHIQPCIQYMIDHVNVTKESN